MSKCYLTYSLKMMTNSKKSGSKPELSLRKSYYIIVTDISISSLSGPVGMKSE